jgi:TIR domain
LEDASTAWADQKDVPFHSCFLSYNRIDETLTKRIYKDLSRLGLRCWFAPIDLRTDHLERALRQAIENTDKLLIVLSKHSLASPWVAFEAEHALAKERTSTSRLLFPLLLDQSAVGSELGWVREVQDRGYGIDFSDWQDNELYGKALDALVAGFALHF